jgi:HlyD family secretion protein
MSQAPAGAGPTNGTARYIPAGSSVYRGTFALLPGMTANVTVFTQSRQDVLRVPNAALRFNPAAFVKEETPKANNGGQSRAAGAPSAAAGAPRGGGPSMRGMVSKREDRIWILEAGKPKAIPVKAGISDGQFTEISGEHLTEGMTILVGAEDTKKAEMKGASPLGGMPRR